MCNDDLLTVEEVAAMLGLKASTLRRDVTRRPETLPPRVVFPNSRRVRFRRGDVTKWINQWVTRP